VSCIESLHRSRNKVQDARDKKTSDNTQNAFPRNEQNHQR
jgi:hypothetical protein